MKLLPLGVLLALRSPAAAETLSGFAGSSYVVSPDRVCTPLAISADGQAIGTPSCQKVETAALAKMAVKAATAEAGASARFKAKQDGKQVVIQRGDGSQVAAWSPIDPLVRVGAVFASADGGVVAAEVVVRRMSREATDIIGFQVGGGAGASAKPGPDVVAPTATTAPPIADAAMLKLLKTARKSRGKKALAAWAKVQAVDAENSEARIALAIAYVSLKQPDAALAALEALAVSTRSDAIEYLVGARFDKAFRKLSAEPRFRTAVGLDRGPTQLYDRVMGTGGSWEQQGTSCAEPTVALALTRARTFQLTVKTVCDGQKWSTKFKGTWKTDAASISLVLPNKGAADEVVPCSLTHVGEEDNLSCKIDDDLEFTALPVRR